MPISLYVGLGEGIQPQNHEWIRPPPPPPLWGWKNLNKKINGTIHLVLLDIFVVSNAGRHAGWKSILTKFFHFHADFG